MFACFKRELKSYFTTLNATIYIVAFLVITGIYTLTVNFYSGYTELEFALSSTTVMLMLLIPLLTMRFFTEEHTQNVLPLTYSLPIPLWKQVMAKFFACTTVFSVPLVILCLYPLILSMYGDVVLATAYWGLFGYFLLGLCMIAVGMLISSLTKSPAISAVATFLVFLLSYLASGVSNLIPTAPIASLLLLAVCILLAGALLYYLTKSKWISLIATISLLTVLCVLYAIFSTHFSGLFADLLSSLSIFNHYYTFYNGMIDLTAVFFYLSFAFCGLAFCILSVEKKRWS
jgi:ABC-2 type transport system permease protein